MTQPSPSFVCAGAGTAEKMVLISTIFFLLHEISGVPIIFDKKPQRGNTADGQCTLTLKLGRGTSQFLEDCPTLGELIKVYYNTFNLSFQGRFEKLPKPSIFNALGVHPKVCCPKFSDPNWICFEGNGECTGPPADTGEDFDSEDNYQDDNYYYEDYEDDYYLGSVSTPTVNFCFSP